MEYGNIVWSLRIQKHVEKLGKVHHRATKIIPALKDKPYEEHLQILKLSSLASHSMRRDDIETCTYTHKKYSVGDFPFELVDLDIQATRKNGFKIYKNSVSSQECKDFLGNRVINVWNALPSEVVQALSQNALEARLVNTWKVTSRKLMSKGFSQNKQQIKY